MRYWFAACHSPDPEKDLRNQGVRVERGWGSRLEAIAFRLEAIAFRLEAIAPRWDGVATGWRPSLVGWLQAVEIVLIERRGQQRRTRQPHLDAQTRSTAGTFAQALRERLRWLSSHAGCY